MKAKDIVEKEVARQAEFGMEPSWEDFVIAVQDAGIQEALDLAVDCDVLCTESDAQSCGCAACKQFWIEAKEWKL